MSDKSKIRKVTPLRFIFEHIPPETKEGLGLSGIKSFFSDEIILDNQPIRSCLIVDGGSNVKKLDTMCLHYIYILLRKI